MEAVLQDKFLKDFIDQEVPKPAVANATELVEWKKWLEQGESLWREFETT